MQVVRNEVYCNFVNSINSDQTRRMYEYSLSKFLKHYDIDLDSFLKLPQQEISNFITDYLVNKKISRQYKVVIFSAIKHACEMNDVILNWKKLKQYHKLYSPLLFYCLVPFIQYQGSSDSLPWVVHFSSLTCCECR